jgi:hypothetical protein
MGSRRRLIVNRTVRELARLMGVVLTAHAHELLTWEQTELLLYLIAKAIIEVLKLKEEASGAGDS